MTAVLLPAVGSRLATRSAAGALSSARRGVVIGAGALALAVPAVLATVGWPRWWVYIAPEQTPMTWLQSVDLVLAASVAVLIAVVLAIAGPVAERAARSGARHARIWPVLAAGFLWLALDERFAVHERLRDRVLAPRGIRIPFLPWVAPGDFLLILTALAGIALMPRVRSALREDRTAARIFAVGVLLAGVAVGMDSLDPSTMSLALERLEQTLEECVELVSGLAFLSAMALRLLSLLDDRLTARAAAAGR